MDLWQRAESHLDVIFSLQGINVDSLRLYLFKRLETLKGLSSPLF